MNSEEKVEINVLGFNNDNIPKYCGYCKNKIYGRYSFFFFLDKIPVDIYDNMKKDGWGRCGNDLYIFNSEKSCCKYYMSRLKAEDFKINKEQKKIMKRFEKYLSGEYELNREKLKQKELRKDRKMKNIDELQIKIEKILRDYLKQKTYIQIIEKYVKIDNSLLEERLNEIHVKKNKFNFDYSIDFIYVILKIIESENKKNNSKFDNTKNLQLDLFNDFKKFYREENEELHLSDKTGHINIIDKTKSKKKFEKINPEMHLPVKHIYTCELTDKIKIDDEKFKVYEKYQKNILKSPIEKITREFYDEVFGTTNLIDNKGIKLPSDLNKKTDHPEMYPKKYGTYDIIHRIDGKIIAVGVWDILPTSLCSVSLYYDSDYKFLDLGVVTAIKEIEYIKSFHDLIDNNFKYYSMGLYCETAQKLRYKGNFQPTELLDRYTMNYVYLKDVQKIISDGKNHILSQKEYNPNKKFLTEDEINKYINDLIEDFKKNKEDNNFKEEEIEKTKRFIELVPKYLVSRFKFIAKPDK